jgi:hypothetical protein
MDKTDNNAANTAIGAAMAEATAEKKAEVIEVNDEQAEKEAEVIAVNDEQVEIVEYTVTIPENESPMMYKGIAIYGSQLVSIKFMDIVKHALEGDDFLKEDIVKIIVFSMDQPVDQHGNPSFACYKPEPKLIGFNLQHHFDGAVELIKEIDGYMSLRGHIWYNMILSLFHELYHGLFIATDTEKEMSAMSEIEETCNDLADEALTALAREFDIEPPSMGEEPFFGTRYMEFYIREIREGKDSWCIRQDALHDGMNIHYDDERKEYIKLFRTFMRYTHGGDSDHKDPTWDVEPQQLMITPEAVVAEVVEHPAKVVQEYGQAPPAAVFQAPTGQFHGIDEEAVAMMAVEDEMGGESSAYVMEDYDTLPAEAAGIDMSAGPAAQPTTHVKVETTAPVVVNRGADTVTPAPGTCAGCNAIVEPTAAFCSGCGSKLVAATVETAPAVEPVVVAQLPTTAPPTAHRGAPGQQLRSGLVNHEWTADQFRHIVERILFRAYAHLFNKCGYNIMARPAFDETQKWGVLEPVFVGDACEDDEVNKVLLGHDIIENGINRINVPITDGFIRGFCTKKGMLPCYTLYFNANGREIKRILLPTNPWKEKTPGVYSKPAIRAQQGAIIAWMMDGDDNATDKWRGRIENSIFYWS